MGGINFSWLDVWVLSADWLGRKLEVCDICQALRCPGGEECEPCPDFVSYALAFGLQLRKIKETP